MWAIDRTLFFINIDRRNIRFKFNAAGRKEELAIEKHLFLLSEERTGKKTNDDWEKKVAGLVSVIENEKESNSMMTEQLNEMTITHNKQLQALRSGTQANASDSDLRRLAREQYQEFVNSSTFPKSVTDKNAFMKDVLEAIISKNPFYTKIVDPSKAKDLTPTENYIIALTIPIMIARKWLTYNSGGYSLTPLGFMVYETIKITESENQ